MFQLLLWTVLSLIDLILFALCIPPKQIYNEQYDIFGSSKVSYMTVCRWVKNLNLVYPSLKMQAEKVTKTHLLPERMCLLLQHLWKKMGDSQWKRLTVREESQKGSLMLLWTNVWECKIYVLVESPIYWPRSRKYRE